MKLKNKNNRIAVADFQEIEAKKESGELTSDEFNKIFTQSRFHGLNKNVYPFAVGGSDAAIILGISKYKTPRELAFEKIHEIIRVPTGSEKIILEMGHAYEGAVRNLFSLVTGITVHSCTQQFMNQKYNNLIANIDGLVEIDGEIGLYEGKTTRWNSKVYKDFKNGICPLNYYLQVQFYLEILELPFAYICCAWGLNPETDYAHIKIDRDPIGEDICSACQHFVDMASRGSLPTNKNVLTLESKLKSTHLEKVKTGFSLKTEEKLDEQLYIHKLTNINSLERDLQNVKEEIETLLKPSKILEEQIKQKNKILLKDLLQKKKSIEEDICGLNEEIYKNMHSKSAYCENSDFIFQIKIKDKGPSFNSKTKEYIKEIYPEVWDDLCQFNPILPDFTITKTCKN